MITGEKIIIKGITRNSATDIYNWVNIEELRNLTGTLYPVSEYEHEKWIEKQVTSQDRKLFLICDKVTAKGIGIIGLKNIDWQSRNSEIFITIGEEEFRGGGYGVDAVKTLVRYCFTHLNLHKIYLRVFESNISAIHCYKKAGFLIEGTLIDQHFCNGKYENIIIMGVVSSS